VRAELYPEQATQLLVAARGRQRQGFAFVVGGTLANEGKAGPVLAIARPRPSRRRDARRDWAGVREFARDYCKNSSRHTQTVIGDLRQVIWVFIQNLNQTLTAANETDTRIKDQSFIVRQSGRTTAAPGETVHIRWEPQAAHWFSLSSQCRIDR
jgi:hypothetical protein